MTDIEYASNLLRYDFDNLLVHCINKLRIDRTIDLRQGDCLEVMKDRG